MSVNEAIQALRDSLRTEKGVHEISDAGDMISVVVTDKATREKMSDYFRGQGWMYGGFPVILDTIP